MFFEWIKFDDFVVKNAIFLPQITQSKLRENNKNE